MSTSSYFDTRGDQLSKITFLLTTVFLISLAGFRPAGVDRDYLQYVNLMLNEDRPQMEPTFKFISYWLKSIFSDPVLPFFLIYAIIGVTLKVIAIRKISNFFLLSIVVYFSYSFILHDTTQIRAGAAIGFALLSITPLYERKFLQFLSLIIIATLFHYSSFVILVLWFLNPKKFNQLSYLLLLIISYFAVSYAKFFVIFMFTYFPEDFQSRAASYDGDFDSTLNIFNTWQLIRCVLCVVFITYANKLLLYNNYAFLLIKIYVVGTAIYVLLSSNPAFAGRISDLFFAFDILTLPMLVNLFQYKPAGKIVIIGIASTYLFLNLYYLKIIS
ncbi:EpsG family protein [Dyadobacter sp. 3J3]|uniref:EpsG family protein n=1 Tax=Dyadobacter sp. 3J3 TaxID=2606600 RepID=UPI001356D781|nr:EpsG family protein [Dyadobacter sp. 3J3]